MTPQEPLRDALVVRNMSKTFDGTRALSGVDLAVRPGEIRALVGQNGCGKSTLIKILAGYHEPDPDASVFVNGVKLRFGAPAHGARVGLRFVHQDLGLVQSLDSLDNIALGNGYVTHATGQIHWRKDAEQARAALLRFGYRFDVRRPVQELTMSQRTGIAIARALSARSSSAQVLFLDEPTANLPASEVGLLFDLVRSVSDQGVAVVFVSHHLEEVFSLADTVSVLRDGCHVHTGAVVDLSHTRLVEMMIGKPLSTVEAATTALRRESEPILELEGMATDVLSPLNLSVHRGEIVGVAGITGSGREAVAPALFGAAPRTGTVRISGQELASAQPPSAIAAGVGLVPADRHHNAVFGTSTVRENITIAKLGMLARFGRISRQREGREVANWMRHVNVKPSGQPERLMSTLSGGNQQKVIMARWLRHKLPVMVLDSPTQGVDVGSKEELHDHIRAAASAGAAVLVVSTDHEELAGLCDWVCVLSPNGTTTQLAGSTLTADHITAASFGGDLTSAPVMSGSSRELAHIQPHGAERT